MNDNNILKDNEYFYMFGKMLNGNDEYDIKDFNYLVLKNDKTLDFIVAITDKKSGKKEITFSLSYQDDIINYTNNYKIDSLESRIITVIFNQIIYSIGEARNYDEDVIVNWMNQIDLSHLTNKDGIKLDYEKRTFSLKQEETTYDYDIFIPKAFTIDINNVTNNLPDVDEVKIDYIKVDL